MEQALGTAIGLGVTYLFLAVVVSALVEAISGLLSLRAKKLCQFLSRILEGGLGNTLNHPLIKTLGNASGRGNDLPSYIPTHLFSRAFLSTVGELEAKGVALEDAYQQALAALPPAAQQQVKGIVGSSIGSLDRAEKRVAEWFDASMDRLSGDYRRYVQWVTRGLAVVLVLAVNANSMTMGETFWRDPAVRDAASQLAKKALETCQVQELPAPTPSSADAAGSAGSPDATGSADAPGSAGSLDAPPQLVMVATVDGQQLDCSEFLKLTAERLPLPLGWTSAAWCAALASPLSFLKALFGMLLTMIAVSFGAPFWFDILRKVAPMLQLSGPKPKDGDKATKS